MQKNRGAEGQNILWTNLKVSLFPNSLTLGMASAVFSYPTALLPGSLKATQCELKESTLEIQTEHNQYWLIYLGKSLIQNYLRNQNANASTGWKKEPHLQSVRLLKQL